MALQAGEREVSLSSRGRAYTIDFTAMQQIDDDTGSPSKVLRQEWDVARGSSAAGELCKLLALCIMSASCCVFLCIGNAIVYHPSRLLYCSALLAETDDIRTYAVCDRSLSLNRLKWKWRTYLFDSVSRILFGATGPATFSLHHLIYWCLDVLPYLLICLPVKYLMVVCWVAVVWITVWFRKSNTSGSDDEIRCKSRCACWKCSACWWFHNDPVCCCVWSLWIIGMLMFLLQLLVFLSSLKLQWR